MAVLVVSCFGPRKNDSMVLICANWSMTCWLTSILSMSVEAREMLSAEAVDALAPQDRDLKPEDLLSPLHLMCVFKKLNLF